MRYLRAFLDFKSFMAEDTRHVMPDNMTNKSAEELRAMWASQAWNRGRQTDASFNWGKAAKAAGVGLATGQIDNLVGGSLGQAAGTAANLGTDAVEGGIAASPGSRTAGVAKGLVNAGVNMAANAAGLGPAYNVAKAAYAGYKAGQAPLHAQAKAAAESFAQQNGHPIEAFQLSPEGDAQILKALGDEGLATFYKLLLLPKNIQHASNTNPQDPHSMPMDYANRLAAQFMKSKGKPFSVGPAPAAAQRPAEKLLPQTPARGMGFRPGVAASPLPAQQKDPAEIRWLG